MKDKLNLGSGKTYLSDYLNVDIAPQWHPDILADMRQLTFPPDTFREIMIKDTIDHVSFADAKKVLANCYRWLKPNGVLLVHTPNLQFIASLLATSSSDEGLQHEATRWLYGCDGADRHSYASNVIRWGYTKASMRALLESLGFMIVECRKSCNGFAFFMVAIKQ